MRDFNDNDHANNRLSRCYMAYKQDGKWVITRIAGANLKKIATTCGREFDMKSQDIMLLMPKLGYANAGHQCAYITRSSKRMWKVGLTPENTIVDFLYRQHVGRREDIGLAVMLQAVINEDYPTAKQALDDVRDKRCAARAFSRKFCFGRHRDTMEAVLYYKNKSVGYYDSRLKSLVISDTNSHIIQQVIEAMGTDIKVTI